MFKGMRHHAMHKESEVLHGFARATPGLLVFVVPMIALGQAAPPQYFVVCASQVNLPTIYFSGVLQGPATALQGFKNGFVEHLSQQYSYQGPVACWPTNTFANAQNFINSKAVAFRNAKHNVVETAWTESAAAALASATAAPAAAPAAGKTQVRGSAAAPASSAGAHAGSGSAATGGAGADSPTAQLTSVLNAVFGNSGSGCGATGTSPPKSSGAKSTGTSTGAQGAGAAGCSNTAGDLSNTLANAFTSAAANGPGSGHGGSGGQSGASNSGLGSAETQTTKLVVYGCGRQDTQIACVSELTNKDQKDTLVQAADVWQDTFIVDDRGDRHVRSGGFFLNIDGDQRSQLDISYGKTAKFILMFSDVQSRVQKVALRSTGGGLDVEDINLITPGGAGKANSQ